MRVLNIEAQREALPMRCRYEADVVEPLRSLQLRRVDRARADYQERKLDLAQSGLSMEERLEARRDALRSMRAEVVAADRELRPQPFDEWLSEVEEQRERGRLTADRQREQGQTVGREGPAVRDEVSQAGGLEQEEGQGPRR